MALFTYMFLHGGVMHLAGNMVFLWLVGAFLEAAVGTLQFVPLYLIAGVLAGGLFGMVYPLSPGPLIGASGAIAGLMGAYGIVFGLRKIRVFYSVGFYFDYAMIPALALFPVWLGKECLQLYVATDRHVAYVAHIGGLLSGIFLGTGLRLWKKEHIESLFAREHRKSRAEGLFERAMEKFAALDFKGARVEFNRLLEVEPDNLRALQQLFLIEKTSPHTEEFHKVAHLLLARLRQADPKLYPSVFEEYRESSGIPRITLEMLEQLGHLYLVAGNFERAATCIFSLLRRVPEHPKIPGFLLALAKGLLRSGKTEDAGKCLRVLAGRYAFTLEGGAAEKLLDDAES